MRATSAHHAGSPWTAAVDHWLTGLLLAIALALLVVAGAAHSPFFGGFFREVEATGVDVSMRLRILLFPHTPIGREAALAPAARSRGFVFIDVGATTCREAGGDERCVSRSPALPAALARVATAVLQASPRVVIVDAYLWDSSPQPAVDPDVAKLDRAAAAANIPVIAAAPARPTADGVAVDWTGIPDALRAGAIDFAPAIVWSDPFDGIVRRYPMAYPAHVIIKPQSGPAASWQATVPSLPYLAALYASARGGRMAPCWVDGVRHAPASCAHDVSVPLQEERGTRILFSIPSPDAGATTWSYAPPLYRYMRSPFVVGPKGELKIDAAELADKVVVVGTTAPVAMDAHVTPLGQLSGAEIILNATRSFIADAAPQEPSLGAVLLREAVIAFFSSLPFLLFWFLAELIARRASATVFSRAMGVVAICGAFAATIAVSAGLSILVVVHFIGASNGEAIDAMVPLAVLSLEGFAHAAKYAIDILHSGVVGARTALGRLLAFVPR